MPEYTLHAGVRNNKGKEAAKKIRKNNQIPAVFYGPDTDPLKLVVDYAELDGIIKQTSVENIIIGLEIESGEGSDPKTAMPKSVMLKELQVDPIKNTYLHADFYEVSMEREVTVGIPILLLNTPAGVQEGGILQHVRREIEITCLPDQMVEHIDVDVSGLDIGDSIHIRDIDLPEGMTTTLDESLTVAVVAAPTVVPEEEEIEEIEGIEGEEEEEKETEGEGTDSEDQSE
jgi:large subunit ribosomal protein L25